MWQIVATGALVPRQHPLIPGMAPVCWLTSDPHADREALGLTSDFISCDRMTHLFKVTDTSSCARWSLLRLGACSGVLHPGVLDALERFADPELWWLSTLPVPVERVP